MKVFRQALLWAVALSLLLGSVPGAAQQATHPLDPLSAEEIRAASKALHARPGFPEDMAFAVVALNDPPKKEILAYKGGSSFTRQVFTVLYDREENKTFQALVDVKDLKAPKIDSWVEVPGVQPMVLEDDGDRIDEILRGDPGWNKAVKGRGLDPEEVTIDYWAVGTVPEQYKGRRLLRGLTYLQRDAANFYGQPVEGITALVDLKSGEVLELTDTPKPPLPLPARTSTRPPSARASASCASPPSRSPSPSPRARASRSAVLAAMRSPGRNGASAT
ncbi:MAG TPA: hypothetical protein VE078_12490 [Thermoanaerobaculia bacterium]|nr:hypothetical protein [Thermoanaerobaculia bacterium]